VRNWLDLVVVDSEDCSMLPTEAETRLLLVGVAGGAALHWLVSSQLQKGGSRSSQLAQTEQGSYKVDNPWWILPCLELMKTGGFQLPPVSAKAALGGADSQLVFGPATRKEHFLLEEGCAFINHGSYGATLRCALEAKEFWLKRMEAQPVRFMDDEILPLLSEASRALASFISARPEDLALVPNATTAVNAVVRSLPLRSGDVCLSLDISYGACKSAIDYACLRAGATLERVVVSWPYNPDQVVDAVEAALNALGSRVKFCLFDHITSCPAVLMPVRRLVSLCKERGVLCMVDGAHAVGAIDLRFDGSSEADVGADFYTSNCHKWLMTPKGTAFLHVRKQHQHMVRPTVISHGYALGFVREVSICSDGTS
jgi:hypothetical protein